jgi:hypothetical protein
MPQIAAKVSIIGAFDDLTLFDSARGLPHFLQNFPLSCLYPQCGQSIFIPPVNDKLQTLYHKRLQKSTVTDKAKSRPFIGQLSF